MSFGRPCLETMQDLQEINECHDEAVSVGGLSLDYHCGVTEVGRTGNAGDVCAQVP